MRKLEFAKYAVAALAVAGLTALAAPAAKAANEDTATVTVRIATAITVLNTANMDWGTVVIPVDTLATYDMAESGLVTEDTTTGQVVDDAGTVAAFTVLGLATSSIALTLTTSVFSDTAVSFSELDLFGFTGTDTFGSTGTPATGVITSAGVTADVVKVRGKLDVTNAANPAASPTATLTLVANYQ